MKSILTFSAVMMISILSTQAQTFDEYKKIEEQKFIQFKKEQEEGLKKLMQSYNEYVQKADRDFANYIEKQSREYKLFKKVKIPSLPKPESTPHYKPVSRNHMSANVEIKAMIPRKISEKIDIPPILPLVQRQGVERHNEEEYDGKNEIRVDYFGTPLVLYYGNKIHHLFIKKPNGRTISAWWLSASRSDYNFLVNQLMQLKNQMGLNDWAYFCLARKVAKAIATNNNETSLLSWFLMIRSGYDIKVAYDKDNIYVLFPSVNNVYGRNYVVIKDQPYYYATQNIPEHSFLSFNGIFPGATQKIDFSIKRPMNIGENLVKKDFSFMYEGKKYTIKIVEDLNTIAFMKEYPQTDLRVFFNAAVSQPTKESIAESMMPILAHMNTRERLNFLLSFVQKAFLYKTDMEQFGREKYFFPEEVFYYKYSDCEDRAALFSSLVGQLLHLDVIGLEYRSHVATAVQVSDVSGDYISFKGKRYVIADPTYINAPLGMEMPEFRNEKPIVFGTNRMEFKANVINEYWRLVSKAGGFRGGNLQDAVFDKNDNCYLTGYYLRTARFGNMRLHADGDKRQGFIAKYDKNKEVVWAHNVKTIGSSTGFALALNEGGDVVLAGSFNGKIVGKNKAIISSKGKGDVFFACYTLEGDRVWLRKAGLDTINKYSYLNYVVRFNSNGSHFVSKLFFENEKQPSLGFSYYNHIFTFIGGLNNTTGFNSREHLLNESEKFTIGSYLKGINDNLIKQNVNRNIAGLMAAIYLANINGMIIPGDSVQSALDRYNPTFKASYPAIYKVIGDIALVRNSDGIVRINIQGNKSVSFSEMKINNGAQLRLVSLPNGREQVDVLSGVRVGKLFVWYPLNFIQILPKSGDLLFDYDADHTQKVLNLKKDILY